MNPMLITMVHAKEPNPACFLANRSSTKSPPMQLNWRRGPQIFPTWKIHQQCSLKPLVTTHLAALHHSSVLLLEPFVEAGRTLEVLVDAAHDAGLLTVDEGLGGEVVDTVVEAALNHLGVHLGEKGSGSV